MLELSKSTSCSLTWGHVSFVCLTWLSTIWTRATPETLAFSWISPSEPGRPVITGFNYVPNTVTATLVWLHNKNHTINELQLTWGGLLKETQELNVKKAVTQWSYETNGHQDANRLSHVCPGPDLTMLLWSCVLFRSNRLYDVLKVLFCGKCSLVYLYF